MNPTNDAQWNDAQAYTHSKQELELEKKSIVK